MSESNKKDELEARIAEADAAIEDCRLRRLDPVVVLREAIRRYDRDDK